MIVPAIEEPPKRQRFGGKPTLITEEIALRIADRFAEGLPLRFACALETPAFSEDHFKQSVNRSTRIASAYDRRMAEHFARFLALMNNPETKLKAMPAQVWVMERRFAEYFGSNGKGSSINVQVNTCIGLSDDIAKRARAFVGSNETANERRRLKDK